MASAHNDLTQGGIFRQLVKFAVPLAISSVLQSMYGIVDMIVAGHFIGSGGMSAINNSSSVMLMVTNIVMGLCTGGNILIGQYFGAKNTRGCHSASVTLCSSAVIFGVFTAALLAVLARPFLRLLDAPALEEASAYLRICSLGIIAIAGYNATSALLRAVGNSRAPLICVAVTAVLNVLLDLLFVAVFRMGVAGAALATVIAQFVSFGVSLCFVLKSYDLFGLSLKKLYIVGAELRMILKLGIPCAVQMSVAGISWLSVMYIINGYGVIVSAGNGVAVKIKEFCQLFTVALGTASSSMIAQNIGAKQYDRARKTLYTAMLITVSVTAVLIILVELFAPQMASLFTSDGETIAAAVKNLRIEVLGQLFYAIFLVYHSLALGAGNTWFVFFSSFTNCIAVRLILAFWFSSMFGIDGVYWACMIAPLSSVPLGLWYERSNRWQRTLV